MKSKIKKWSDYVLNIRFSYKTIIVLLFIALIALMIPMAMIARYDVPSSDDFGHGIWTHPEFISTSSLFKTVIMGIKWVSFCFYHISGTFSVQLFDSLAPNVFGERYYVVTFYIMAVSLFFGLAYFYKTLFSLVFKTEKEYCLIITLISLIIVTQFLPSCVEGFYWYVGAITYTFYFSLFLVAIALLVKQFCASSISIGRTILSCFLFFLLGGGNHVTALLSGVILVGLIVFSALSNKKKKITAFLFPVILWTIAFAINCSSPGNAIRSESTGGGAGFLKSFVLAFRAILLSIEKWSSLPFIACILFLVPVLWLAASKTEFSFGYPAVITFFSFCFLAAMYYPPIFAMNSTGMGRLNNIVFFSYTILLIVNIFYWSGWIAKRVSPPWITKWKKGISVCYIAVLCLFIGFGVLATIKTPVSSLSAAKSLLNGEAKSYYSTQLEREELLHDNTVLDVVLPAFNSKPYTIFFHDITNNPTEGQNVAMAEYYLKDSVVVEEEK